MTWLPIAVGAPAAAYQLVALAATVRHLFSRKPAPGAAFPEISLLKPIRGLDDGFFDAIRSHAEQDYPAGFEILFGVSDPCDPAVTEIERLSGEFPQVAIRIIVCHSEAPNGKVGVLMDLAREARHPVFVVNDSDITVPSDYLRSVVGPLEDPAIGVVTCLYRAESGSFPGVFEAIGIATDFAPSTLVAPFVGISEFGLGSTLAFRRSDLDAIGAFTAIADYIADDYQLGARIHGLGRKNVISMTVVSTNLHAPDWRAVWKHQLRWARTIRVSRGGGYAGLPLTNATLWAVASSLCGYFWLAGALLGLRFLVAFAAGWLLLRSQDVLRWFWLIPFRDLYAFLVWIGGLSGSQVEWRGFLLRLDSQGRIMKP